MSYKTIIICVFALFILIAVSVYKGKIPVLQERFSPQSETRDSKFCEYKADTGYTCPLVVTDGQLTIQPYAESGKHAMESASQALKREWGSAYSPEYILKKWEGTDVLYVMTKNEHFVGCVAVDRQQFVPVLSHLYVVESERNNGHARKLLQVIDKYVKEVLLFNEIKLWCDPKLKKFYESFGWQVESHKIEKGKSVLVMNKIL